MTNQCGFEMDELDSLAKEISATAWNKRQDVLENFSNKTNTEDKVHSLISEMFAGSSISRLNSAGDKKAWWTSIPGKSKGFLVIFDPYTTDCGTAFPADKEYYLDDNRVWALS